MSMQWLAKYKGQSVFFLQMYMKMIYYQVLVPKLPELMGKMFDVSIIFLFLYGDLYNNILKHLQV